MGPFLFFTIYLNDFGLEQQQQNFLACFVTVVYLWLFSKTPLFITGFIGVALSVITGVSSAQEALAPYASPIIFLFLGGFLLARAMQATGLDKRLSLYILTRDFVKGSFLKMMVTLYALTAVFSMWVSNTATAAMMLPIILGIIESLNIKDKKVMTLFLLGMAYSASIGGLGTPIGSPPNIIAIGFLKELAQIEVTFLDWTMIGVPIACIFLAFVVGYIWRQMPKESLSFDNTFLKNEFKKIERISNREITIAIVFLLTITLWFLPSFISLIIGSEEAISMKVKKLLPAGVVAMLIPSLLFIFPLTSDYKILKNEDLKKIDWGSLLLFGSGLSLGKTLFQTGLAQLAGDWLITILPSSNLFLILIILALFTIFSTEIASNTASANILIPIMIAMSAQLALKPLVPVLTVAFACSLAFMLPVATPPNAIVYGSEKVEMKDMIRFGFILNIVFAFILALVFSFFT